MHHSPLIKSDIESYLKSLETKDLLRFITCGSVDDGKSTLIGRLLYESKMIYEDQMAALERDSKKVGTRGEHIDFALLVDGLAAEREQGITIDVAYRYFSTDKRKFIVADTPGHEQYTRNMATGASTSDLAVLMIDARKGVLPQTKRHSLIVNMLGVKKIVLAINKMDLIEYNQDQFKRICREYEDYAREMGISDITPIPVSAVNGDNVSTRSDRMNWFDGPTLLSFLETVTISQSDMGNDFSMPVQWVNRPHLDFRGFSGQITSGTVSVGDTVKILPSERTSKVNTIVTFDGNLSSAIEGQSVTLTLDDEVDASRGDMIVMPETPIKVGHFFQTQVLWMTESPLLPQKGYWIKFRSNLVTGTFKAPEFRIEINSGDRVDANQLNLNEIGVCHLELGQDISFLPYAHNSHLGSFIIIDRETNNTVGMGLIQHALDDRRWADRFIDCRQQNHTPGKVSHADRLKRYQHKPCVVILTGENQSQLVDAAIYIETVCFDDHIAVYRNAFQLLSDFTDASIRQEMLLKEIEFGYAFCDSGMVYVNVIPKLTVAEYDQLHTLLSPFQVVVIDLGSNVPEATLSYPSDSQFKSDILSDINRHIGR